LNKGLGKGFRDLLLKREKSPRDFGIFGKGPWGTWFHWLRDCLFGIRWEFGKRLNWGAIWLVNNTGGLGFIRGVNVFQRRLVHPQG